MLSGYKTYIVGALALLGALGGYLDGDLTWMAAAQLAVPALLSMTVRHGMTTTAAATQAIASDTASAVMAHNNLTEHRITDALNTAQLNRVNPSQPR